MYYIRLTLFAGLAFLLMFALPRESIAKPIDMSSQVGKVYKQLIYAYQLTDRCNYGYKQVRIIQFAAKIEYFAGASLEEARDVWDAHAGESLLRYREHGQKLCNAVRSDMLHTIGADVRHFSR